MTKQDEKKLDVPKLSQEVKKMNGKSGYKVRKCLDALCEILDEDHKAQQPKTQE